MSTTIRATTPREHHVCPWWVGYLLASPIRRLGENPERLLGPLARPGMTAIDVGCAMGFFSLPLARMVRPGGRVVCVDVQQRMLDSLTRRARRRGLLDVLETRLATQEGLEINDLEGRVDLALAIHVVHESAHPARFLEQIRDALRPGGRLLIAEPSGHVSADEFASTRRIVQDLGLDELEPPALRRSSVLLAQRPDG
jgi:2-polyprenyl-3-methyl-5-hydroxy-6-metoxy-1,4-benzoquinol methylase